MNEIENRGREKLWSYFGLSYASWLTLPRVMLHEMPDEWQEKLALLLEEWDKTWINQPNFGTRVQITKSKKLFPTPDWILNYRHPDKVILDKLKNYD